MTAGVAKRTVAKLTIAFLVMILAGSGLLERGLGWAGLDVLSRANHQYLDASYERAVDGFLVLSAVKTGLAVIEGSEVGIGFNLQVGDLVQSVYDYVDIAWKTVLAGGTVLVATRLLLDGIASIDHAVLALACLCMGVLTLVRATVPHRRSLSRWLHAFAVACTAAAVILYLILPLAILGASHLSERITRPVIRQSQVTFEQVRRLFVADASVAENTDEDRIDSPIDTVLGIGEGVADLKQRIGDIQTYIRDQARQLTRATFQLIAAYLFDCVLFPLSFAAAAILLLRHIPGVLVPAGPQPRPAAAPSAGDTP